MENKRIILVIFALLTLATLGTAIGEIYSKEQYKALDMDKYNFNLAPTGNDIKENLEEKFYWVGYNYETIVSTGEGYEKVLEQNQIIIPIEEYNECREGGATQNDCIAEMKATIIDKIIHRRERERQQLKEEQKTDYSHELNTNSIVITAQELNAVKE